MIKMNKNKRLKYKSVEHYEETVKIDLCRYFYKFSIIREIYKPRINNLWIDRLSESHIHFEANVKNHEKVDFKISWVAYLATMANQNLN